jgi:hypothetical protein
MFRVYSNVSTQLQRPVAQEEPSYTSAFRPLKKAPSKDGSPPNGGLKITARMGNSPATSSKGAMESYAC